VHLYLTNIFCKNAQSHIVLITIVISIKNVCFLKHITHYLCSDDDAVGVHFQLTS